MKTQVNHHHQLNVVGLLISISILLLAFGIYKTIQFQEKEMFKSYTYTSEVTTPNEIANNHSLTLTNDLYKNETPLEIESWMLDYSTWLTKPNLTATTNSYPVVNELEIKDWMLNTSEWFPTSTFNSSVFAEYEEEALIIEDWMLSTNEWITTTNSYSNTYYEEELKMEEWMLITDEWEVPLLTESQWNEINSTEEEELPVESWMIQCCTWITAENMNEAELFEFSNNIKEESLVIEALMTDINSRFTEPQTPKSNKKNS